MKKKPTTLLFTAILTLGSSIPAMASSVTDTTTAMPTFSYSNTTLSNAISLTNVKLFEELNERTSMLKDTIYAESFKDLSLGEQMVFVEKYFTVRADIHKENQKTVLSATEILELQRLKESLIKESDNQYLDTTLIHSLIQELQTKDMSNLKPEEVNASKEMMTKLIVSYKDMRTSGRNVNTLINTQIKAFHSSQLRVLNKFGTKYELSGDKLQALELAKKMLKLSEGDVESYKKVSNLLTAEKKSYFFVDNEVIEVTIPFLPKKSGTYMDISDLAKVQGFEILNEKKKLTVKNGDNIMEVNKKHHTTLFNGTPIGKGFTVVKNGKLYLPIDSVFELFHYNVKWEKDSSSLVIHKQVYEENELDSLSVEDMMAILFPHNPKEEVEEKEAVTPLKKLSNT